MVNFHSYVILSQPLPEGYRHFMRVVIGISWESSNFIMGASQRIFHKLARSDQPNCCDSAPQRIRAEADSRRHPGSWTTRPATSGFPSDHQWIITGWFISGKFRKNGGELGVRKPPQKIGVSDNVLFFSSKEKDGQRACGSGELLSQEAEWGIATKPRA